MDWRPYIERKPEVMGGKPVICGTRITVQHIVERLGDGWSMESLLDAHPQLKAEHLRAALSYAAQALATDETVFLSESA